MDLALEIQRSGSWISTLQLSPNYPFVYHLRMEVPPSSPCHSGHHMGSYYELCPVCWHHSIHMTAAFRPSIAQSLALNHTLNNFADFGTLMYILIYYNAWHPSAQGGNSVLFCAPCAWFLPGDCRHIRPALWSASSLGQCYVLRYHAGLRSEGIQSAQDRPWSGVW